MRKRIDRAFGKDVYLLGKNQYGEIIWLEAPSWDCNWYWGFGYVEVYTNQKNPSKSRDIDTHTHWDYIHKENENPIVEPVFSKEEYAELKKLFSEFYSENEKAKKAYRQDEQLWKTINEVVIPEITGKILKILTP